MKDLILAGALLLMGILGYMIMTRLDIFLEKNRRKMLDQKSEKQIRIAAESPFLAGSIVPAIDLCLKEGPSTGFSLCSGKPEDLLKCLSQGQVDLLILSEGTIFEKEEGYEYMLLPFRKSAVKVDGFDETISSMEDSNLVYVLWNNQILSPNRDWLISVMRNGFHS